METVTELPPVIPTCVDFCFRCHQCCLQTAMNHCLVMGGEHIEPEHFRLMMNCAEICQACANLQLSGSAFSDQQCAVCAAICEECAVSCERIGRMDVCVQACLDCAKSCRSMASTEQ